MARDYARPPNRPGRPAPRGGASAGARRPPSATPRGLPGWLGLLVGLAIGLVVAAFVYIGRPTTASPLGGSLATGTRKADAHAGGSSPTAVNSAGSAGVTTPAAHDEAASGSAAPVPNGARKPVALPPKQPSRFGFYEMLPSYEVVIPKDAGKPAAPGKPVSTAATSPGVAAAIAAPGQYLIQVGAYRTRDEADKGRANLALLGVESRIEQVTIDQTETWYRVRIGPENDLAKAQEILQRLEANDIKGMLIKVKSG